MRTELIRIDTPKHPLDGPSKGAAKYFNGNHIPRPLHPRRSRALKKNISQKDSPKTTRPARTGYRAKCDPFYVGVEVKVPKSVTDWLKKALGQRPIPKSV